MTDHYAVVGNPVDHSLSPQIHAAFARHTGADIDYIKLPAPFDGFERIVRTFFSEGGLGLNVTLPFKHSAWQLVDERLGDAASADAVNVIDFRNGRLVGHNTDGLGLLTDLAKNLGFELNGRQVLLLGAGGAAQGVMPALLRAQPAALT